MDVDFGSALHLINGPSAAVSLREAFGLNPRNVLANEDPLYWGPVPSIVDPAHLIEVRSNFLSEEYGRYEPFWDWRDYQSLQLHADRLAQGAPIVVWAARGLPDQLFIAFALSLCDRLGVDASTLTVMQFEHLRPRQIVVGMGEVRPEDLVDFQPPPKQLATEEADEYRAAWSAFTSDDPADLKGHLDAPTRSPTLRHAMERLVFRYPSARSGLSACDEALLKYTIEKGPQAARVVGYTMGRNPMDAFSDLFLVDRLLGLEAADLPSPLVSTTGLASGMRGCEVFLTDFGRAVLAGEANAVERNGIDVWIGGVRLLGATASAYRDEGVLTLASS